MSDDGHIQYIDIQHPAQGPVDFYLTPEGALGLAWIDPRSFSTAPVRVHVLVPASEVQKLRRCLEESSEIQETLAAKPPTQSKH